MLLAEPPRTAYDLQFRLLGIPVRITPFFWVVSVLLGWNFAQGFAMAQGSNLNIGTALIIWTIAVLLSILVHEFGHALAFLAFGVEADVVLYQFGGLAVPRRALGFGQQPLQDPKRQIVVGIAGPAIQLVLGIAVLAAFHFAGYAVLNPLPFVRKFNFLLEGDQIPSFALWAFEDAIVWSSIWWALLNLLPIYPLDGGQIAREMFTLANPREGIRFSLILSLLVAGGVAAWGFTHNDTFMGIMFALLAYSSFTTLQAYFGGGRGFGGRW